MIKSINGRVRKAIAAVLDYFIFIALDLIYRLKNQLNNTNIIKSGCDFNSNSSIKFSGLERRFVSTQLDLGSINYEKLKINVNVGDPQVEYCRDVFYLPIPSFGPIIEYSGLYSSDRELIEASCCYRGYGYNRKRVTFDRDPDVNKHNIIEEPFIYVGPLINHYGHFLTECTARMWFALSDSCKGYRFLYHGDKAIFKTKYFKDFLSLIGIEADRFMSFNQITKISEVMIPYPSMANKGYIFEAHKKTMEFAAARLMSESGFSKTDQPLYLSRVGLRHTRRKIINERALVHYLANQNVKIVEPEKLSLYEQIKLFNNHDIIIGSIGSAHHSTLFSLDPKKHIYFCKDPSVNYLLIDSIKKNDSTYCICLQKGFSFKGQAAKNSIMDMNIAKGILREFGIGDF